MENEMIRLVILEIEAKAPGNYSYVCFRAPEGIPDMAWGMMGHLVIDMQESEALRLLEMQATSLNLQFQLAEILLLNKKPEQIISAGKSK